MSTTTASPQTSPVPAAPRPPRRPATFADLLRSEWVKFSSVRSTWVTLVVTVALGVGVGVLISLVAGNHYASSSLSDKATWDPTGTSLSAINIAQLAIAVLGVMMITSEYSSGMIRTSLAAVPRRGRFLASKAVVFTAVALVVGEIIAFVAFLLGQLVIGTNAPHTDLGAPDVLRAVIGAGLYLALVGLLAMAIGALVRNTAAGISAIVALQFVLPGVVQALPDSWRHPVTEFWPTQAGSQIFVLHRDTHTLAAWSGFGVMVLFTAMVLAGATFAIRHRDA
jgi:ABC-2 type transport system permease protein